MNPLNVFKTVQDSTAHAAADSVYQVLTRADRVLEADRDKKPWAAAGLSLLLPGAGQFYNRQLVRAALLLAFFGVSVALLVAWALVAWLLSATAPEGWPGAVGAFAVRLGLAVPVVAGGLWLFAILDAWRTAAALRAGRLLVRYSFLKQAVYLAAGFVPGAGILAPEETVIPADANKALAQVLREQAGARFFRKYFGRLLKLGFLVLAGIPLLVGAALDWPALVVLGGLIILVNLVWLLGWTGLAAVRHA